MLALTHLAAVASMVCAMRLKQQHNNVASLSCVPLNFIFQSQLNAISLPSQRVSSRKFSSTILCDQCQTVLRHAFSMPVKDEAYEMLVDLPHHSSLASLQAAAAGSKCLPCSEFWNLLPAHDKSTLHNSQDNPGDGLIVASCQRWDWLDRRKYHGTSMLAWHRRTVSWKII